MRILFTIAVLLAVLPGSAQEQARHTVYFDFDRHQLTAAARRQLDSFLLASGDKMNGRTIFVQGHCDAIGSNEYNDALSAKRVNTIEDYLIRKGFAAKKVNTSPRGEREPLNENRTDEERQLNRRVEITFGDTAIVSLEEQIKDPTVTVGTNIVLKNINFYGGRRQWLPASQTELDELLRVMKTMPKLVIEIHGHICCQPGNNDGLDIETGINNLSMVRAETIHDFLRTNGIEANRVSWRGFGHSQPLYPYPENSEEERTANRRVEIKIISK
jgi:outer membrane protein OmpA-like peptidoglycan-associated protein